jgi:Uma2 family endonuclease
MSESGLLTYADLASFPDDGFRRELLGGDLLVTPSPNTRHQVVTLELAALFRAHLRSHGGARVFIAPLDVLLSDRDVVQPDVFVVLDSQREIVTGANVRGVPALVVEVLSDPQVDQVRKRDLYARFRVPEYWVVDPTADRVEVYRFTPPGYGKPEIVEPGEALRYEPLPGLQIDVAALLLR